MKTNRNTLVTTLENTWRTSERQALLKQLYRLNCEQTAEAKAA